MSNFHHFCHVMMLHCYFRCFTIWFIVLFKNKSSPRPLGPKEIDGLFVPPGNA